MKSYIHLYKKKSDFTASYNGPDYKEPWLSLTEEGMEVNYNKPKLTAITFDSITWITDVPATGGTATKDNCTFKVYAKYDNGISVDISSDAIVTGELVVPSSTAGQRHEAGQLTLTASYGEFTATGNVTAYQEANFSMEPLTFNILSAGTINWTALNTDVKRTIDYKLNDGEWASITSNTGSSVPTITVNSGDKLQFKGNNEQYATGYSVYNTFSRSTALFEAEGNIMSLIYGDNFKNKLTISSEYAFLGLFSQCVNLVSAENLILPATTLADSCYYNMFYNCPKLATAPKELPATTLARFCYGYMFRDCASLTAVPSNLLPATKLADYCYYYMFYGCTKLTTAPLLPATTLANWCYQNMFYKCTSLTTAPELPATALATCCYDHMFYGCSSLTTAPELPATKLAYECYGNMFDSCTSLTTVPELPATTLADECYYQMFWDCTRLNYIKCLATDISASRCTTAWVRGVASTGTFVKNPDMTSWTEGVSGIPTGWAVVEDNQEPLTFNILSAGTINWTASSTSIAKTIDYKLNDNEWVSITSNTGESAPTITVKAGDKLQFRGNNATYCGDNPELYSTFSGSTASFEVEGNIMSLIYGDDFKNNLTISSAYAFYGLFRDCAKLVSAENLVLPATTLADSCYDSMFQNCTSLTTAPKLPARTLATSCYSSMFKGCTSLTTAPELPAETLANSCYSGMFQNCSSLTTAPSILPATTLRDSCYYGMFMNCTSLITAPELPANTLAQYCYGSMFQGCISLTTAPTLPATTLVNYCYYSMFSNCTSLTTAPELPATTLANYCYCYMFQNCRLLNYIKCLATDISASDCTFYWVRGVASTGTFVKNPNMTSWSTGTNGVPVNWTVEECVNYAKEPLTFKISSDGTINWMTSNSSLSKTIEYKLNDSSNWLSITSNRTGVTINVSVGDKIQFRGNNATYYTNTFSGSTAGFEVEGNIMSLVNSTDFITATTLQDTNTFRSLFNTCTGLTSAENLVLPATTLAESCYNHMFKNCTSLTTAPALPATTLATYCYSNMFDGCTSLTTAPELPATTLVTYCYNYMFYGCRKLNYIKCLAKNISASKCTNSWVNGVASTGTFVKASSMTSWATGTSGIPSGWKIENA